MPPISQSVLYYIAAGLFAMAAAINLLREPTVRPMPVIGIILTLVMLWLAVQTQRRGG